MDNFEQSAFSENGAPALPGPVATGGADSQPDPFAAENFSATSNAAVTTGEDLTIELRTPSDEEFVRVSDEPRHHVLASLLVVSREEGYGKSYFLLTPNVRLWAGNQPSLAKFVKAMHLYLFQNQDGEYGVWSVRDGFDNWATSELQVVETAKRRWTRRYTQGKVRKAHTSTSIDTPVDFPDKAMPGKGGILAQVFGEAFVITSKDGAAIKKLMG